MSVVVEECHLATVVSNNDEEQMGRILVVCPALLPGEDEAIPQWVKPFLQWGWFTVPDVGEQVEVVAVTGATDDEAAGTISISAMNLRWRGARTWTDTGDEQTARPVHPDFKINYPKRRGFATPVGHIIWFDDTRGAESITIKWSNNKGDTASMAIDAKGGIVLTNKKGAAVAMDGESGDVLVADAHGNTIAMDSSGVVVTATSAKVDASMIELGGSVDFAMLGNAFSTWASTHVHTSPGGLSPAPTSPPLAPPPANAVSTKVKLG